MKSCRIPYENLKTLFIKSYNFDKAKYRYYRNSITSILGMNIQDEAKVHAVWFMGIVYNNALNLQSELDTEGIVTEGLPIKISDLVKDKLSDPNTNYKELLKDLKKLLKETAAQVNLTTVGEIEKVNAQYKEAALNNLSAAGPLRERLDDFREQERDDRLWQEKGFLRTGITKAEEKPLTTAQKLNKIFTKIVSATDATLNNLFNEFEDVIAKDALYDKPAKIKAYNSFLQAISKLKNTSAVSLKALIDQKIAELSETEEGEAKLLNVRNIPVFGQMQYVRKQNGDIKLLVFNDGKYFSYSPIYNGENVDALSLYTVEPTDYITPVYGLENLEIANELGNLYRLSPTLSKNGLAFEGARLYEEGIELASSADNRTGAQKISDNLSLNVGLTDQIKVIADRRRILMNRARVNMLNQNGYDITFESKLTPAQFDYLARNPNKGPVVTSLMPRAGVDLIVSASDDSNWDYIMSLDTLGFVYPDGTTRFINWDSEEDIKLFMDAATIKTYGAYVENMIEQPYTYEKVSMEDVQKLRQLVSKIKELKSEILETMDEDAESFEIPNELFAKYFNIANVFTRIENPNSGPNSLFKPVQTLDSFKQNLLATNSLIKGRVAQFSAGKVIPSTIREENILGIIKKDPLLGYTFEPSIEENYKIIDENNNEISYQDLFEREGLRKDQIIESLKNPLTSKYGFFYLVRTKNDVFNLKPLYKSAPITETSEVVNFLSTLNLLKDLRPEFTEDTADALNKLIRTYNNSGWGFNAYKGISANIDFIRTWNNQSIYGIRFRASGDYALEQEFNKRNLTIEFKFDYDALQKDLDVLYKELNLNPAEYSATAESRLRFGNAFQTKLEQNKNLLTPAAKKALENIQNQFNNAVIDLNKSLNNIIEKHTLEVNKKPEAKFLENGKDIKYLLFRDLNNLDFKLASRQKAANPLLNYKVFEHNLNNSKRELIITPAKPSMGTAATIKTVVNSESVNRANSSAPVSSPTQPVKIANKRKLSVVESLNGLSFVGSKQIQEQIEDIKRMIGSGVKVDPSIISDKIASAYVLGYFEENVIKLNKLLPVSGVAYHEAFHAIFRLALSNEERAKYLEAAKAILGNYKTDATGNYLEVNSEKIYLDDFRKKRNFAGVQDEIIVDYIYEEYLADGFRDYKLNKAEPKNLVIRILYSLLDKLVNLFKSSAYRKAKSDINKLYADIDRGTYANVIGDKYQAPRAYSLSSVPTSILESGEMDYSQVDNYTNDQLVDRITREMLKRSGDIVKGNAESFNKVYDEVTKELIEYFNTKNFITEDNPNAAEIISTYEPMFRSMRFLMGAAHRTDVNEVFVLDNLSDNPTLDNFAFNAVEGSDAFSFTAYNNVKDQVKKAYEGVGVITENDLSSQADQEERDNSDENDDDDFISRNDENEVGESYEDNGILTYKPYEGSAEFQKLIKYIKYTFTDERLGVSFDKMVNSREVVNQIRKITYNTPKENIVQAIHTHIEYLKENIDKFNESGLANELGYIPNDMIQIIDDYNTLKAVYETLDEQAVLNESFLPTRALGTPFYNMFANVFYRANANISSISINTKWESVSPESREELDRALVKNRFYVNSLVERSNIKTVLDKFRTNLGIGLEILKLQNNLPLLSNLISKLSDYKYIIPTNQETFDYEVNRLYTVTSYANLNIPRNVIEFAVASSVKSAYGQKALFVDSIINQNKKFFDNRNYFDIQSFVDKYRAVVNSMNKNSESVRTSTINSFVEEYEKIAPYQIKYDPSLVSNTILNQDNKPINQSIPYVPSVQILNEIRWKGLSRTLVKYYGDTRFFYDNPVLSNILNGSTYNPNDESQDAIDADTARIFFDNFDISVAGGMFQEFNKGSRRQSTYKGLGSKGYALSVLGLFANRVIMKGNYGQDIILFERPITQLEATSTQFNMTGLYENYTDKSTREDKIKTKLKQVLKQEFNRINREWAAKDDVKLRYENYNCRTLDNLEVISDDPTLRAYNFNRLSGFFNQDISISYVGESDDTIKNLHFILTNGALTDKSFEEILNQKYYTSEGKESEFTVEDVLSQALFDYAEEQMQELTKYFESIDIQLDDIPSGIRFKDTTDGSEGFVGLSKYDKVIEQETNEQKEKFYLNQEKTKRLKESFIKDFGYNFWFNSLTMNQLFDGDLAVSIDNIINFFKRQKSGVIAGNNYRNINIEESNDNTVFAVFRTTNGYLDSQDPTVPMTMDPSKGDLKVKPADGQGRSAITRRIKKFKKDGIDSPRLEGLLKKLRYTTVTADELTELNDNGIFLGSDKPAVGHPYFYYKDSEHYINRSDSSIVLDEEAVAKLYDEVDALELDNPTLDSDALARYRELMREIHSYFVPKRGREANHYLLNSMEYHRVDVVFDDTVSKKSTVQPLIVDFNLLDAGIMEGHGNMRFNDHVDPVVEDNYINLSYNAHPIPNDLVYEQVSTIGISDQVTDSIQKKLLLPAQLDPEEFPGAKKILDLQLDIVKSRLQLLQRLFNTEDPKTLVTKAIQAGLMRQGAGENLLKLFSLNSDNKNQYNLNLPILGKQPMFYFFSLFNNSIFGPKVPGKKFYHVSGVGYKIVVDENDNPIPRREQDANPEKYRGYKTRYPTVKEVFDKDGNLEQIVIEVIIPKELASNPKDIEFFEKLYTDFLATRIPTADKRSMVRAKVVDHIDATYGNSIIVPAQVHLWAGSDLDIDALYAETYGHYRNVLGRLVKYGDYKDYTKLGLTLKNAEFIEYLHYMATDPVFSDIIDSEYDRIKSDEEFKTRSLANAVGLFGEEVAEFFSGTEEHVLKLLSPDVFQELARGKSATLSIETTNKSKKKGVGLESLGELMNANVVTSNKTLGNILKLMDRLVAVVNVLNTYNLPSTPEDLAAFSQKEGNPVHLKLHNEILKEKMDLLADPRVYETFLKNSDGDKYIQEYAGDRSKIDNISEFKGMNQSDPYLFQTVGKVRTVAISSKDSVSANANQVKSASLIATAKVKLSKDFTFNFVHNGVKLDTQNPINDSVQKIGGATDVSLDDTKHQNLAPLNISKLNAGLIGAMYIYGYPSQFARLINSVDLIAESIKQFSINDDPSYSRSVSFKMGFPTFLNNKTLNLVNSEIVAFTKLGVVKPSENKINKYEIDHSKITIEFNDVASAVEGNAPSNFNITVKNSKGDVIEGRLASIVLLSFYNKMSQVGNAISFKIAKITDVNKKLRPSFRTLSAIKNAVDFVEDNKIFENADDIFKHYPYLAKLAKDSISMMTTRSKEVLLDETNLFKAFTSLFRYDKSVNIEDVTIELKSILALSSLNAYVDSKINDINEEDMSAEDVFIQALHSATNLEYWDKNKIESDLNILKRKFPKNEFLKALTPKPALYSGKGRTKVITSLIGSKLSIENQNRIINDFYQLISDSDESVYKMAVNIAVHGIVKDGGISKNEGFLKIIAPELFKYMSAQLDLIQDNLYKLDTDKGITAAKYTKGLDQFFKDVYRISETKGMKKGDVATAYTNAILRKLVSTLTKESTGNPSLRLSFFQGNERYLPGKFADISMPLLRSIVDTILPNNAAFIYKTERNQAGLMKTVPVNDGISQGNTASKTRFEFWKADNNGELLFDLSQVNDTNREVVNRLLLPQDIYQTKDGNYSFPLYQINNFKGDQIFLLTELDGKPFSSEFINNLFDAYKSEDEFQFLLRGTTAKYKVVERQGADRISPNAFKNNVAVELKKKVDSTSNVEAASMNVIPQLSADAKLIDNSSHIRVESKELADRILGSKYAKGAQVLNVGSVATKYSTRGGKVFMEGKSMNPQQLNEFANKLGFSSFEEATKNTELSNWMNTSGKLATMWVIPYTTEDVNTESRIEKPEEQSRLFGLDNMTKDQLEFHINTLNVISGFLENIGVEQRMVPEFLNEDGSVIKGAVAAANFLKGTVDVIDEMEKRPAAWNKMPEEAAHWWYRLLKTNSPLKEALWNSAKTSDRLNALLKNEYGELYNTEELNSAVIDILTEESIGQLIAEAIKKIEDQNAAPEDYSFLKQFIDWINAILEFVTNGLQIENQDPFAVAAAKILTSDTSDLLSLEEYKAINDAYYFSNVLDNESVNSNINIKDAGEAHAFFSSISDYGSLGLSDYDSVEGLSYDDPRRYFFYLNVSDSQYGGALVRSLLNDEEKLKEFFSRTSIFSMDDRKMIFNRLRNEEGDLIANGSMSYLVGGKSQLVLKTKSFDTEQELANWLIENFPVFKKIQEDKIQQVIDDQKYLDKLINTHFKRKSRYLSKTIDKLITVSEMSTEITPYENKEIQTPTKKLGKYDLRQLTASNNYENITPTLKVLPAILEKYGNKVTNETIRQKVELTQKRIAKDISKEDYERELKKIQNKEKGIPIVLSEPLKVDGLKKEESAVIESIKQAIINENPGKKTISAEELVNEIHNFLEVNYMLGFANEKKYLEYNIDSTFEFVPPPGSNKLNLNNVTQDTENLNNLPDIRNMTEDEVRALPFDQRMQLADAMGMIDKDRSVKHNKISLRFNDTYHLRSGHFDLPPSAWANLTYFYTGNSEYKDAVLLHEIQNDNIEYLLKLKKQQGKGLEDSVNQYLMDVARQVDTISDAIDNNSLKIVTPNAENTYNLMDSILAKQSSVSRELWFLFDNSTLNIDEKHTRFTDWVQEQMNLTLNSTEAVMNDINTSKRNMDRFYTERMVFEDILRKKSLYDLISENAEGRSKIKQLIEVIKSVNNDLDLDGDERFNRVERALSSLNLTMYKILDADVSVIEEEYGTSVKNDFIKPIFKPRTNHQFIIDDIELLLNLSIKKRITAINKVILSYKTDISRSYNTLRKYYFLEKFKSITPAQLNKIFLNMGYNKKVLDATIDKKRKQIDAANKIEDQEAQKLKQELLANADKQREDALDQRDKGLKNDKISEVIELELKYFAPLVHYVIQKHIKKFGKDMPMYFSGFEITNLTQSSNATALIYAGKDEVFFTKEEADMIKYEIAEKLNLIPKYVLKIGENSVPQSEIEKGIKALTAYKKVDEYNLRNVTSMILTRSNNKPIETGTIYNAMTKIPGIKLIWQSEIPGLKPQTGGKKTGGYLIDLSNYTYSNPLLFGLANTKKEVTNNELSEDNDPFC